MKNLTARLLVDVICWTALTVTLVVYDFLIVGALVGSFGIIYVTKSIIALYYLNDLINRINEHLNRTTLDDGSPKHIDDE